LSSIAACLATLRVVAARYGRPAGARGARQRAIRLLRTRLDRFGVLDPAAEARLAALEAEAMAASLSEGIAAELAALIRLGEAALPHDPKFSALLREIRLIRLAEPEANILVYTEYADSQAAAVRALAALDGTVLTISGAQTEAERTEAAERCAARDGIVLLSTDSLAEGLNLQQRCHHLIHLDLPYNPNRLEQRNGRIDRYGQRRDPHIRYLYLADTFEERLLLHLIAKYEKARACLSTMPDTLGMTAPAHSLRERLVSGFAEDGPSLFGAPLIRTLDLAAETEGSEAYRDLLREIDRAFHSFDRMAVRHGWLAGRETAGAGNTGPPPPADLPVADLPVADLPAAGVAAIDLPAFVASMLEAEGPAYRIPAAWQPDLDGLPGFDAVTGIVRLAQRPEDARDGTGAALLYPGRAHPLTRRAVAAARMAVAGRVSAARAASDGWLLTYVVEVGTLFRRVFGLHADAGGSVRDHDDLLAFREPAPGPIAWPETVVEAVIAAAVPVAQSRGERLAAAFAARHAARWQQAARDARAWLERRAAALCGPRAALTGDLFAPADATGDWRILADPVRRLTALAADAAAPRDRRSDASEALRRFRGLGTDAPALPRATIRLIGVLRLRR
jgi:hypothetical protein